MSTELVPPDLEQCQTEIRSYQPFIMGGNVNQVERCKAKPVWLATEKNPGADGKRGKMSLCDSCKAILIAQFEKFKKPLPTFKKIPTKKGAPSAKSR